MLKETNKFRKNITEFCLNEISSKYILPEDSEEAEVEIEETNELLNDFYWDIENPDMNFRFKPVYEYETKGNREENHIYRHKNLFGRNACKIYECGIGGTGTWYLGYEGVEVWLLDDLSIALAYCVCLDFKNENIDFKTEYRYIPEGTVTQIAGDFEVEDFLDELSDSIILRH